MGNFFVITIINFFGGRGGLIFLTRIFSRRFDTSGSMIPRLVPEISSLDAFCDGAAGIGDSRSWIRLIRSINSNTNRRI